jgi:predicted transport protein
MKAIDRPFTNIINGTTQFVIPVFQRDYSWTEATCEQLWKDILHIAEDNSGRGHFLGSVVCVSTGDSFPGFTRWLLIDGQQRLTTLTLMLAALRDHIREAGWDGGEDGPTAKRIEAYFLKNVQEEGSRQYKLVLRRHDQETLRALLDGGEMPAEASERVRENYEFFREQISGEDPNRVYAGIGRLVVVDVTLDRGADDPQLIFESLNSTGMDLGQSDLIRNFLLMRLTEKEQTRLYESYWSKIEALFRGSEKTFDAFIRDYMALKTQSPKQERADEIYQGFRRVCGDLQAQVGGLEPLLDDVLRFARYHAAFSVSSRAFPEVSEALARLRRLVDVPAPLVMRLFDCYGRSKTLPAHAFNEALRLIESYIFRRAICGEQTRGYWQTFANLAYRIDESKPLESLKVGMHRLTESYRYPSDEDFRRELQQRDVYALRVCGFLLDRLENHGNKEPTDTSSYSVEHILPQNEKLSPAWKKMLGDEWQAVQRTWLHRLGNLTLTGYNSTYSDRPFEEKKTIAGGFNESSVRLNKYVREQPRWTASEIEHRGRLLADQAVEIWPALHVAPSAIEAAEQAELRERAAMGDVSKVPMDPTARQLFEDLRARIREIAPAVVELAESKSVSYHAPSFFLEVLPRSRKLTLLLALDYTEVDDPTGMASDATQWKFFANAKYEGGVYVRVRDLGDIVRALPIIRQALALSNS